MDLPRIPLSSDNMTSLFLLNREADDMFSMYRGNTDFILQASLDEYIKCLKEFVIPNRLVGSFIFMFPHTNKIDTILQNYILIRLCFMGDLAHALAKDACMAAVNLSSLSNIEWTGLDFDTPPTNFTKEELKVAEDNLLNVLDKANYYTGKKLKQYPYNKSMYLAIQAYATAYGIKDTWNFTL